MGMLSASEGADLLNPAGWVKSRRRHGHRTGAPASRPGSQQLHRRRGGDDLLVFHAGPYPGFKGTPLSDPNRHAHVRKIWYGERGEPIFQ